MAYVGSPSSSGLGKVSIVGSGLIGRSWAAMFARRGYEVYLYDTVESQLSLARSVLESLLTEWQSDDMLREGETAKQVIDRIHYTDSLEKSVKSADYVQECVPEKLELKQQRWCPPPGPLRRLSRELQKFKKTSDSLLSIFARNRTGSYLTVSNRIQYAVLMECWRLIEEGVCSVEDADITLTEGIGMRYAFMGNFQTMQLNAQGVVDYCERYGENIKRVCVEQQELGARDLSGPTLEMVASYLNSKIPLDKLEERRAWRDGWLKALSKEKMKRRDTALQNL